MFLKVRTILLIFCISLGSSFKAYSSVEFESVNHLDLVLDIFTDGVDLPTFPDGKTEEMYRYMNQKVPDILSTLSVKTKIKKIIFRSEKITFVFGYPFDYRVKQPNGEIQEHILTEWSIKPHQNQTYGAEKYQNIKTLVEDAGRRAYISTNTKVSLEELIEAHISQNIGLLTEAHGLSDFPRAYILNPTLRFRYNYVSNKNFNSLRVDLKPIKSDFSQRPVALTFESSSTLSVENLTAFKALDFDSDGKALELLKAIENTKVSRRMLFPSLVKTDSGVNVLLAPEIESNPTKKEMDRIFSSRTNENLTCLSLLNSE